MSRVFSGVFAVLFAFAAGCSTRSTSSGEVPSRTIAMHDKNGVENLRVDFYTGAIAWRSQQGPEAIVLQGPAVQAGVETDVVQFGPDPEGKVAGLRMHRGKDELWRLTRIDGLLRVGDTSGIPLGRILRDGNAARLHGPGGELIVSATEDGGRIVVTNSEKTVVGFVSGSGDLERAALLHLKGLGERERALILSAPSLP